MKKLTTIFLSLICGAMMAQIPNASFENWTSGSPNGWTANRVIQTDTAYVGSSAARISSVLVGGNYYGGTLQTGNASTSYFFNSGNFDSICGWYILHSVSGDEIIATGGTQCSNMSVNGAGTWNTATSTAVYKAFGFKMTYSPPACTADSATISFALISISGYTHAGSYAIIDDLRIGSVPAGVNNISTTEVSLEKAYPNPASTVCNVIYSIPSDANVNVSLYDISGRMVKTLLSDTQQTPGIYKIPVDVSSLSDGIYIYRVVVNGQAYSQKLTVARN